MTRNVTVPRQVVWILEVTGTPTTGVLDHTDSGLWGSKENRVMVTSSIAQNTDQGQVAPKAPQRAASKAQRCCV